MNLILTEVEPETAELLAAQAQAQGLSVDAYLRLLLGMPRQRNALAELSDEEFDTATYREWRRLIVTYAVSGAAVHDARQRPSRCTGSQLS